MCALEITSTVCNCVHALGNSLLLSGLLIFCTHILLDFVVQAHTVYYNVCLNAHICANLGFKAHALCANFCLNVHSVYFF